MALATSKRFALASVAITLAFGSAIAQPITDQPDIKINAAMRAEVIDGIIKSLNESYVFPEIAKKMELDLLERTKRREYDTITSAAFFSNLLTRQLQDVSHDKHLRVRYSAQPRPVAESIDTALQMEMMKKFGEMQNFGFHKLERLPGNIGYIDLRGFMQASLASETAVAAMNFLANTEALIIDLRQNGGGDPAMVALLSSYLFGPEPVHLNSLYDRQSDMTHQWWTLPYVPGKRYLGKDVYVLTSDYTFSAAEEFSYNLKNLKRATIIGETTGGGAHPGGVVPLGEHFRIFVPSGRAINPISGTNWEGTGVQPDVPVRSEVALATAHLMAAKKRVASNTDPELKKPLDDLVARLEAELKEMESKAVTNGDGRTGR